MDWHVVGVHSLGTCKLSAYFTSMVPGSLTWQLQINTMCCWPQLVQTSPSWLKLAGCQCERCYEQHSVWG